MRRSGEGGRREREERERRRGREREERERGGGGTSGALWRSAIDTSRPTLICSRADERGEGERSCGVQSCKMP